MSDQLNHFTDPSADTLGQGEDGALQGRLSAAGASWRRDVDARLPQANAFTLRMRQQIAGERANQASGATVVGATPTTNASPAGAAPALSLAPLPAPSTAPSHAPSHTTQRANARKGLQLMSSPTTTDSYTPVTPTAMRQRFTGLAAGATALVVVALLAATLAFTLVARQHGLGADSSGLPYGMVTPTPAYITSMSYYPVIAPSDPLVVYTQVSNGTVFERSSDGGVTYHHITTPTTALQGPRWVLMVSPLDADHVIATATGASTDPLIGCDASLGMSAGGAQLAMQRTSGAVCSQGYVSADGGQSWRSFTLPFAGMVGSVGDQRIVTSPLYAPAATLFAQGARLYAISGIALQNGFIIGSMQTRLVVSADGGASWRAADNSFAGRICDVAPAPTGSTLYALVAPDKDCAGANSGQFDLLRSDNAGATWIHINSLPANGELGMQVASDGTLYINQPKSFALPPAQFSIDSSPDVLLASRNGGATFTRAPLAGAPAVANFAGPVGVLSDGSVVMESIHYQSQHSTGQATLYAWRAGETSWRKISQQFAGQIVEVVVAAHNGNDVLYIVESRGAITRLTV